jgi:hypothetical protein
MLTLFLLPPLVHNCPIGGQNANLAMGRFWILDRFSTVSKKAAPCGSLKSALGTHQFAVDEGYATLEELENLNERRSEAKAQLANISYKLF